MHPQTEKGALEEWLSQRSAKPSTAVRIRQAPLKKLTGISSLMGFQFSKRKVGRVIDRAGLEILYTLMGIGGLNPSPSARQKKGSRFINDFLFLFLLIEFSNNYSLQIIITCRLSYHHSKLNLDRRWRSFGASDCRMASTIRQVLS